MKSPTHPSDRTAPRLSDVGGEALITSDLNLTSFTTQNNSRLRILVSASSVPCSYDPWLPKLHSQSNWPRRQPLLNARSILDDCPNTRHLKIRLD